MNGEEGDDLGGFQMMGIVNALKTGNVPYDMVIAMCIPLLLRFLFKAVETISSASLDPTWWNSWFRGHSKYFTRSIVHRVLRNQYGSSTSLDEDTRNPVLIKAVQMYLDQVKKLALRDANLNLTSIAEKKRSYYDYDEDSCKTLSGTLSKYHILKKPPQNQWHNLGLYGDASKGPLSAVELMISEHEEGSATKDGAQKTTIKYDFRSLGQTSIDAFIDVAYKWYMEQLKLLEDDCRHYYELKSPGASSSQDDSEESSGVNTYMRYKLSDEKTFESLFFQEKETLLNLVNHFTNKTGKYAIKGYPHKLGLLLHGPPGTGKTSLIKALAQYTGRSIVSVPLSRISTNSELMSLFFDQRYNIEGESVPIKMGFKDVIFVMEDVDAASKVVRRRDGKKTADVTRTEHIEMPESKSIWRMLLESSTESSCQELVEALMEKSDRLKEAAMDPETLRAMAKRMTVLPGLGIVGDVPDSDALAEIGDEAIESANELLDHYSTVDRFMSTHAQNLKALLDAGAEIDDAFVDELLGCPQDAAVLARVAKPGQISRDVSYSKYADGADFKEEIDSANMMASVAMMFDGSEGGDEKKSSSSNTEGTKKDSSSGTDAAIGPSLPSFMKPTKDQLNLTGLLNVLDGVVDTPGRILVMTTNHPEMLDPALIRPGRIDKKIMLGFMTPMDVVAMLEHYFQVKLDFVQKQRVVEAVRGNDAAMKPQLDLTPAQIEQLTAEHDDIEDMICALEIKGQSDLPKKHDGRASHSTVRYNIDDEVPLLVPELPPTTSVYCEVPKHRKTEMDLVRRMEFEQLPYLNQ